MYLVKTRQTSMMIRFFFWLALAGVIVICVGGGYAYWRIHRYDTLIAEVSQASGVEARLIRAVIWRESHFKASRIGQLGEIGLMQVTEAAANEWASANGIRSFKKNDLFKPEINIRAGAWYLGRAIQYWSHKPNPLPYALAEYNAGRSNAKRWASGDEGDANKFWVGITYPSTRRYIQDVLSYYSARRVN